MRIALSDHFTYQKLLRFTMPSIVMMIVTSVYSIVDGFFVSNCVGKNAFAALNLIFPVLMALSAFGFMVGTGGSALIAKTLGEGKTKEANGIFSMLVAILAVGGAVLAAVFFVFIRPISYAVGATELTIDDCVRYGRSLLVSVPRVMGASRARRSPPPFRRRSARPFRSPTSCARTTRRCGSDGRALTCVRFGGPAVTARARW